MASNNQLLRNGKPEISVELSREEQRNAPAWRFNINYPEGILVKTDKQLAELDAAGWKDEPGKVQLLPGHEKVWEEEQAKLGVKTKLNTQTKLSTQIHQDTESKIDHSEIDQKSKSLFEE